MYDFPTYTWRRVIRFHALSFFATLVVAIACSSNQSDAGGCCTPRQQSELYITQYANAAGADPDASITFFFDFLIDETIPNLRIMKNTSSKSCLAYEICDEIPDSFFRFLVEEAISRKQEKIQNQKDNRTNSYTLLTAIIAVTSLVLGAFNTWNGRKRK